MALDVIYRQKSELAELLRESYIPRENLEIGREALKNNLIKVVVGPRRAGKSVYCLQMLAGQRYGYLNFDNEEVLTIGSHEKIITEFENAYPGVKLGLFDEIQNLNHWELLVNTMHRRGYNLVLTGSNANLLSGELATHLTGRYQEIEVYPFSYSEFLKAKNGRMNLLMDYLLTGGYPEVVVKDLKPREYLSTLTEAIIYRDIITRYKIRYSTEIGNLVKLLSAGFTKQIGVASLMRSLGIGNQRTVNKQLGYLEQSYLFGYLPRFHYKAKERIKSAQKTYFFDTGFASINYSPTPDFGRLVENAVFIKLIRQGYKPGRDLFYFRTKTGKEVDYVLCDGPKVLELVQVCYDLGDPKTQKRERSALDEAKEELGCSGERIITIETLADYL